MTADHQRYYLEQMGIDVWQRREPTVPEPSATPLVDDSNRAQWERLQNTVAQCTACDLCHSRTQTVFGAGDRHADLLVVGEAPGANEDRQGEPFVGRAGQLLNHILLAFEQSRDSIYIANVLKCRPPNNRDPSAAEVAQCTPFLEQQIALLQPKLIVATGRIAAQYLLGSREPLAKLRQQTHRFGPDNTPLRVTYHPAYLLRSPKEKKKALQDWTHIFNLVRPHHDLKNDR